MINSIFKHIVLYRQRYIIGSVLFVSLTVISLNSFSYVATWWDEAVYIGMGKYIASNGHLGMWEIFRPPLLPLIYALLFILNLPLILAGKIIVIIASVSSIWLVYLIAESIKKGSGIFACIFLFITPVFFYFSKIATTDIISVFFVLLSLRFYSKAKYFLAGLFVALAFLFRFPQGLALLSIGIIALFDTYNSEYKIWLKELFNRIFSIGAGFFLVVSPYLVMNYILYGDVFKPFILGNNIISSNFGLYDLGTFYYAKEIFKTAPYLYLAIFAPIIFYWKNFLSDEKYRKNLILIILTAIIFMIYFFWQSHKEIRYAIAFLPYLAILSGVTFSLILKLINNHKIMIVLLSIFIIFLSYKSLPFLKNEESYDYVPLYNFLGTLTGSYISTTPVPVVFGNVKVSAIFDTVDTFQNVFVGKEGTPDGVIIKDCDIFCPIKNDVGLCESDLEVINKQISKTSLRKNYELKINRCTFSVYQK